jgi:diacylglycerol kinase
MLKERLLSFKYAFQGIVVLFKTQPNAIIHLILAAFAVGLGIFFRISLLEWVVLVLAITVVLALEAVNTAIELLTDLVSPNFHPLAGKAKDVAAAAVLVGAMGALVIGICLFMPKILTFLNLI